MQSIITPRRLARWCAPALVAGLLTACASAPRRDAASALQLLPPAALGESRRSQQIVHASYGEREASLQCILDIDAQHVTAVGLTLSGQRLFSLQLRDGQTRIEASPLLGDRLPPERFLADLQLSYWPLAAWQAATAGTEWQVSEPTPGTRRLRRGGKLIAEVHYAGRDPWQGRLWLSNFEFGYSLTVEAQPLP